MPRKKAKRRPDRAETLLRMWQVAILIQQKFWTVADLATELETSKATIQRDLAILGRLFVVDVRVDADHEQRLVYRMFQKFKPRMPVRRKR